MFELPPSFTSACGPILDLDDFKRLCYALQGLGHARVVEVKAYAYPDNYYEAMFEGSNGVFSFRQNCYVPYAGFGLSEDGIWRGLGKPDLAADLKAMGAELTLLGAEVLNEEVCKGNLAKLDKSEFDEVRRWRNKTVGALLFSDLFD